MILGFFFCFAACLLWGTSYIAPCLIPSFDLSEILLGRYTMFGLFSLTLLLCKKKSSKELKNSLPSFKVIACLAVFGFFLYDFLDVLNIRTNGSESVAQFYGITMVITPILVRCLTHKCLPEREEVTKALFLLLGLMLLEWQRWDNMMQGNWSLGWLITISQAMLWLYYTRSIAHHTVQAKEEDGAANLITIQIGIVCLIVNCFAWTYHLWFKFPGPLHYFASHTSREWFSFFGVSIMSGIGYGWLATYFWCSASKRLTREFLSRLILADVVAGRLYGQIINGGAISFVHLLGVILVLGGYELIKKADLHLPKLHTNQEF